jgi:hypothetical protein
MPLAFAAWAGCSGSGSSDGAQPSDAGPDVPVAPPVLPPPPPLVEPQDSGPPPRDCSKDMLKDGLYQHLDCTGLYADFNARTLATGVKNYKPGVEFWSDGAEKSRFLFLPPGSKIDTSTFDEWKWPKGTKVWKEFKVDGKAVETRLYQKADDGSWQRTTYLWDDTGTVASRLDAGRKIPRDGGPSYEVPSTGYCDECHQGRVDALLGLEPVNLALSTAAGVTLASLVADGALSNPPSETTLKFPEDPRLAVGVAPPALGWLHVNCGPCHNPNVNATAVFTNLFFLARASQLFVDGGVGTATALDPYTKAVCVKSPDRQIPDGGGVFWTYINGTSPGTSLVSVLSNQRAVEPDFPTTANQMPPIITHRADTAGHALLDAWITALPACP